MTQEVKSNQNQGTPGIDDLESKIEQDRQAQLAASPEKEIPKDPVPKTSKQYPKIEDKVEEVDEQSLETTEDDESDSKEGIESSKEESKTEVKEEDEEISKRIARLAYLEREARKKAKVLEEENARLRGLKPPETQNEEQQRLIRQEAEKIYAERKFQEKSEQIYNSGLKEYKDWNHTLGLFGAEGGLAPYVVEAIMETDAPTKVTYFLGKNLDEYARIRDLKPAAMGAALEKIANKVSAPPVIKQQSKAPAPVRPITGSARAEVSPDKMSIDEWIKSEDQRERDRKGRRRF